MKRASALEGYREKLPPEVLRDIDAWKDDPELRKLVGRLAKSSEEQFFDKYAEIMVARHLLGRKCLVRVEVPTPRGRSADFQVLRDGLSFFVHVKRLAMDGASRKQLRISTRTRNLEKIRRPLVASLSFRRDLNDQEMQAFVKQARSFLENGSVGDRNVLKKRDGTDLGECIIEGQWNGDHITLIVCPPWRWSDGFKRPYDRLSEAYKQFMPDSVNVILATGDWGEDWRISRLPCWAQNSPRSYWTGVS